MNPLARVLLVVACLVVRVSSAESVVVVDLWPGLPPGDTPPQETERDLTRPDEGLVAGRRVMRIGHVSRPTLSVHRPADVKSAAPAVLVFPGGGYHILAWDLEGTEVCEWLNSLGVVAVLVKYRVPVRPGRPRHEAPLQDAQRAIGLVRRNAAAWGVDPGRVGVLGFSAGGHLAAALSTNHRARSYPAIDAADTEPCRPDFAVGVYPGYLARKDAPDRVPAELPVSADTPPTFLAMTQDDPVGVGNALAYYTALNAAKVPAELHLYPKGGHGYGLRRNSDLATTWPDRVADWMRASGWLRPATAK